MIARTTKEKLKTEKLQDDMRRDIVTCSFCNMQQVYNGTPKCFNCGKSIVSELNNRDDKLNGVKGWVESLCKKCREDGHEA